VKEAYSTLRARSIEATGADANSEMKKKEKPQMSIFTKSFWLDWGMLIFSGLLVVVGLLQWLVLKSQAKIMRTHAAELKNLAIAAGDNARAAKDNADGLINSERAWLLIQMKFSSPSARDGAYFWSDSRPLSVEEVLRGDYLKPETAEYIIENYGRSPGWITSQWANVKIVKSINGLPEEAGYFSRPGSLLVEKSNQLIEPRGQKKRSIEIPASNLDSVSRRESFLYVYGIIKYRDVWNKEHETCFCFLWHVPGPGDLNPQGFYQEGPEGYNRQT
jgi:hypothetical protein